MSENKLTTVDELLADIGIAEPTVEPRVGEDVRRHLASYENDQPQVDPLARRRAQIEASETNASRQELTCT